MYLPKRYTNFKKAYPEIFDQYDALGRICRDSGPLDGKSQSLVKLGIAVGIGSRGAVMSHTRKALDEGVTPEEVRHAVLLALSTLGFPHMIAAMSWADEVIESKA